MLHLPRTQDYEYLTTVGEGAYSVVYKCRDKRNGQVVAVKSFKQAHELKEVGRCPLWRNRAHYWGRLASVAPLHHMRCGRGRLPPAGAAHGSTFSCCSWRCAVSCPPPIARQPRHSWQAFERMAGEPWCGSREGTGETAWFVHDNAEHVPHAEYVRSRTPDNVTSVRISKVRRLAEREVSVLRSVRHPGLVELQAAFRSPRGRIYLVFPYYGVSAYQLLRAFQKEQLQQQRIERQLIGLGGGYGGCGGLPALELKLMAWQMLQALSYLHKNQVRRDTTNTYTGHGLPVTVYLLPPLALVEGLHGAADAAGPVPPACAISKQLRIRQGVSILDACNGLVPTVAWPARRDQPSMAPR